MIVTQRKIQLLVPVAPATLCFNEPYRGGEIKKLQRAAHLKDTYRRKSVIDTDFEA